MVMFSSSLMTNGMVSSSLHNPEQDEVGAEDGRKDV